MNKLLFLSALALSLAAPLAAVADDDAVRGAQVSLRNAGYYNGPVDGELTDATKAALRRYQLRNQLEPTGSLTPETAAALAKEPAAGAAPATEEAPTPATVPVTPASPAAAPEPAVVAPVADPAMLALFARTPYQNAAPAVQARVVRDAQTLLTRAGLYKGALDGIPGPGFQKALLRYQAGRGLAASGQLDVDTLAALHLLPVAKVGRPRVTPVPYEAPVPGRAIPRGVPLD